MRWFSIQAGVYNFVHPLLAKEFQSVLDSEASSAEEELMNYCNNWQKHHSHYSLKYYSQHLKNAHLWNDLYKLARDQAFASAQKKYLPDEADLPLKAIQLALSCAAEKDNAGLMAEFMLRHAQCVEQIKKQESPLEALRQESLERALKIVEMYESERKILWYLLLIWELKDTGKFQMGQELLKLLGQKDLLRFDNRGDIDWQGNFAAYFLAHIFEIDDNFCKRIEKKILNDHFRRYLCIFLKSFNNSSSLRMATDIALNINLDIHKIGHLLDIVKAQAKISNLEAVATFNKVLEIIRKSSLSYWDWLDTIVLIRKTQTELGYIGVLVTFNIDDEIAEKFGDPVQHKRILEDLESLENLEEEIQAKINVGEKVNDQDNQADKLIQLEYRLCFSKDFKTEAEKTEALCEIGCLYADKKQYSTALNFTAKINNQHRRAEIQRIIAQAQAQEGKTSAARETFAAALQTVQEREQYESLFLQAIALAGIVEAQFKVMSKHIEANTAIIAYQIAQKINNQTQQAIALALVAEALTKTEKRDDTTAIFNKAIEVVHKIEIQGEYVNSLKAIALAQARVKDFSAAFQTAQNIEYPWTRAEVIEFIAKLQAEAGQWEEAEITLSNSSKIPLSNFEGQFYIEGKRINIICREAILKSSKNNETAQATFSKLLKFARESGNQRDTNLSTVAAALAETGDISTALNTIDEIKGAWEQLRAFWVIAREQFNKEDNKQEELKTTLAAALEAKEKIKNEQELTKALEVIAVIQVLAGFGEEAVRTANTILTNRNWYLPRIASYFIKTRDCTNFKQLLIPCAYYLNAAYHICEILAQLYPEQSPDVAKVVIETNSDVLTEIT